MFSLHFCICTVYALLLLYLLFVIDTLAGSSLDGVPYDSVCPCLCVWLLPLYLINDHSINEVYNLE